MGLFSSKQTHDKEVEVERRQRELNEYLERLRQEEESRKRIEEEKRKRLEEEERREQLRQRQEDARRKKEQRKHDQENYRNNLSHGKVVKNLQLLNELLESFHQEPLEKIPDSPFILRPIQKSSKEREVKNLFRKLNKPLFLVKNTYKINNVYLMLCYSLMKEKFGDIEKVLLKEKTLYRATSLDLVASISAQNFSRLRDSNTNFGNGVIFTRDLSAAANSFNSDSPVKVLVLCKVFFGELGDFEMSISVPEEPSYTATNEDKSIFVKYDDASFLPLYIVEYEEFRNQSISKSRLKINSGSDQ